MQTPIRKPGKYTHLKADPYITPEKQENLKRELERLTKNVRPGLAAEVHRLALMGDFSENAAYQIAKGRLRGINQRILDIEDHLKRALVIAPQENIEKVSLGHHVTVEVNGKEKTYLILGSSETDPATGIISYNSPLGAALMGRRTNEEARVKLNDREVKYIIKKIE